MVPFFHSSRLHNFLQFEKTNNQLVVFLAAVEEREGGCFGRCVDGWVGERITDGRRGGSIPVSTE